MVGLALAILSNCSRLQGVGTVLSCLVPDLRVIRARSVGFVSIKYERYTP
jgi:hypothetical protein